MAKKMGRPGVDRVLRSAKIDVNVMNQAAIVARSQNIHISELLSQLLEEPVRRLYSEHLRSFDKSSQVKPATD